MIEFDRVTIQVGALALRDVTFTIPSGEYGVLMGATGSGKTTLLETACHMRPFLSGEVRLLGRSIRNLAPAECGVGYVPQDQALFPHLTVREHLEFALRIRREAPVFIARRVAELVHLLGIGHLLARYPQKLSGGEAQRVALGRALSFHPDVLLLDEPLSALDDNTRQEMYELLQRVQSTTGTTTLHVTHHGQEALVLGQRHFLLANGRVEEVRRSQKT